MKNRKFLLRQDIDKTLNNLQKSGSPIFQKTQRYMLYALIEDLSEIRRLVPKLAHIHEKTIYTLIRLWRYRKNTEKTIQRKICLLRKVTPKSKYFPKNKELGIQDVSIKDPILITNVSLWEIELPIVRDICSLQYYFGLRKMEAIRFNTLLVNHDHLLITRKLAHNCNERIIPVETDQQKAFLEHFEKTYPSGFISKIYPEKLLSGLHLSELMRLKVPDDSYFRYFYMKNRYLNLKDLPKRKLFQKLRFELGLRGNYELDEVLQCLNVF